MNYELFNWLSRMSAGLIGGLTAGFILIKWRWRHKK